MTKPFWATLGVLAVGAGIAGVVLPLVPTTPFILLAAYCFARSSPRLEAWILNHRTFGPMIANWRRDGSIDPRAKTLAIIFMVAAFLLSLAMAIPTWALIAQGIVLLAVATFILTRPSGPTRR